MQTRLWRSMGCALILLAGIAEFHGSAHAELRPDQLALIVNENLPESRALAEHYAKVRGVPVEQIISIKLPITEEISFAQYERTVVPPIREFLRKRELVDQVTCLVTFYGVPFRVGPHLLSPKDVAEFTQLRDELDRVRRRLAGVVGSAEELASKLDPSYQPPSAISDIQHLAERTDAAFRAVQIAMASRSDPTEHSKVTARLLTLTQELAGPSAIVEKVAQGQLAVQNDAERTKLEATDAAARQRATMLYDVRHEPDARAELRNVVKSTQGLFGYARLLEQQIQYFDAEQTVAALDSELSLLWWNYYPRVRWLVNPLHHEARPLNVPPVMMVMRLDGPTPKVVRNLINASVQAENEGLRGKVVLDSRGIQPMNAAGRPDAYGIYDQTIRDLRDLVHTRTKLSLIADDSPAVLMPGTADGVAIYCGWYSLRSYVPASRFVPGAVGYHIASLEHVSLRIPTEKGWVRGLLNDGMAATMGAVAEPYLHSFPLAHEYFPLLLTGKLTLAEVYWKTAPTSSWMLSVIGDPLYTPYKKNPALAVIDLPAELQSIIVPTALPATNP